MCRISIVVLGGSRVVLLLGSSGVVLMLLGTSRVVMFLGSSGVILMLLGTSGVVMLGRVRCVRVVYRVGGLIDGCTVGVVRVLCGVRFKVSRLVIGGDVGSVVGSLIIVGSIRSVVSLNVVGGRFGKGLRYRRWVGS